jgi:hypothetical protein
MSGSIRSFADRNGARSDRLQAVLVEFLSAVAREGGRVEAVEFDENTLRMLVDPVQRGAMLGGLVSPVSFMGPTGPVTLRKRASR